MEKFSSYKWQTDLGEEVEFVFFLLVLFILKGATSFFPPLCRNNGILLLPHRDSFYCRMVISKFETEYFYSVRPTWVRNRKPFIFPFAREIALILFCRSLHRSTWAEIAGLLSSRYYFVHISRQISLICKILNQAIVLTPANRPPRHIPANYTDPSFKCILDVV